MRPVIIWVVAAMLFSIGCSIPDSPEAVIGRYVLKSGVFDLTLDMHRDGTYVQNIAMADGSTKQIAGTWTLRGECVAFQTLLTPKGLLVYPPIKTVLPKDTNDLSGGYACLPVERWFGKTRIVVSADQDFNYERVSR